MCVCMHMNAGVRGGLRAPGATVASGIEPPDGDGIELVSSESRIHALTPEPAPALWLFLKY